MIDTLPLLVLGLCLGIADAQEPPDADADGTPEVVEAPPGANMVQAGFGEVLRTQGPLVFEGLKDTEKIRFTVPSTWALQGDAELHLVFDNAALLQADRSNMTVTLNEQPIVSLPLSPDTASGRKVVARFPASFLALDNTLELKANHHYGAGCEDPFDPALWSRVSDTSFLQLRYDDVVVDPVLEQLPAPLLDGSVTPARISMVLPEVLDDAALDGLAAVGLWLGRVAPEREIELQWVNRLEDAEHHAILIGRYESHPDIAALVDGGQLSDDAGLVSLLANPSENTRAVLVLTGRTIAGVRSAADALLSDGSLLSGNTTVVQGDTPGLGLRADGMRAAPSRSSFSLADLGLGDSTVSGFYTAPIAIPLRLEGDSVLSRDASLSFDVAYAAGLDTRISTMTVSVDGVRVASLALDDPDGSSLDSLHARIPRALVDPSSVVTVQFHLFPADYAACESFVDDGMWATLQATSRFEVGREHYAQMPDLGRLAHQLWPYTLDEQVGIVTPNKPSTHDAAGVLEIARAIGRQTTATKPRLYTTTGEHMTEGLPDHHLIVLHNGEPNAAYDQLVRTSAMRLVDDPDGGVALTDGAEVLTDLAGAPAFGTLEQMVVPSTGKAALLIRPARPDQTAQLAAILGETPSLHGNIALVPTDRSLPIRSLRRGATRLMGERDINTQLVQGLSTYWQGFFLLLLGSALLFATVVSLWARRSGART